MLQPELVTTSKLYNCVHNNSSYFHTNLLELDEQRLTLKDEEKCLSRSSYIANSYFN